MICSQRPFATSHRSAITAASAESRFRTCCWLAIWFFSCSNSALAASSFSSVLGSATATCGERRQEGQRRHHREGAAEHDA